MGATTADRLVYGTFLFLERLVGSRPWDRRGTLGQWAGRLWYAIDGRHRRIARENVARAFPDWDPSRVRMLVRRNFEHLGAVGAEFLGMGSLSREELLRRTRFEGLEHLQDARSQGKGVFALSGHQGNWELAGAAVGAFVPPVSFVGRRLKNAGVDRRVTELRQRFGGRAIGHRNAVRPILRALQEGSLVGMLMDQKALRREAVASRFFGQPVATNEGLAVLALKVGAPVLPVFGQRVLGGQVVRFGPPVPPPERGDFRQRIAAYTASFDAVVEAAVREDPEQWFWVHKRWVIPEGMGT